MTGTTCVIGSGALGGAIVRAVLQEPGERVRVMSRHPRPVPGADPARVDLVAGSVTDPDSVRAAVADAHGVVVCVESAAADGGPNGPTAVHLGGLRHVLAAATPATHVVLVSQIYVTRPDAFPGGAAVARVRATAEGELRASGVPYTVVRPSWLTDDPGGQRQVVLRQGDDGEGEVAREDVAAVVAAALRHDGARRTTFEVYSEPGAPVADWERSFGELARDGQGGLG